MYTRSYPKSETPKKPEITLQAVPVKETLPDTSIPEGYCGTAILREKDAVQPVISAENTPPPASDTAYRPYGRVRKFKVTTKVTPTLWHTENEESEDNTVNEETTCSENYSDCKQSNAGCEQAYENHTKQCCENENTEKNDCGNQKSPPHGVKTKPTHIGKHRFSLTRDLKLKDRSFSLEDLLLGGLILLLLNEGADDDIILIFGFLLFSGL